MGTDQNGDLGFQQRERSGSFLNCPSSGMFQRPEKVVETTMNQRSLCESSNGVESYFGAGWDPIVSSMMPNGEFKGSSVASQHQISMSPYGVSVLERQGLRNTSHLAQYPADPRLMPCYGSGNFSDMTGSFGLPEGAQIANAGGPSNYNSMKEAGVGSNSRNSKKVVDPSSLFRADLSISDDGARGTSPDGKKRKRVPESEIHPRTNSPQNMDVDAEQEKDVSEEQDEKKQKTGKSSGNSTGKQAKENSQNGETPKEDYIHVRARRGQATNSHSLAERVRREKISERMRLLQDLVPGCNKITGKAVMLDEIINYVQSLQQQVEFLSMKLATVNPELNVNIEQLLSKEILHSRGIGSSILGFGPGMNSSLLPPHMTPHRAMQAIQCTDSQIATMPQTPNAWEDELQSMIQMGFISNPAALDSLGLQGHMKVEL